MLSHQSNADSIGEPIITQGVSVPSVLNDPIQGTKRVDNLPALPEASVDMLISQALDKQVSVETFERLLAMRRELKVEYAREQFNLAMAAFQSQCPVIKKTKAVTTKSGQVAYKYAPIESIILQVKELLMQHGFSYAIETTTNDDKTVTAICSAKHSNGHRESSSFTVPLGSQTQVMSDTQVVAAALTFAKRYAFCNAFGILTGDEDVDARPMQDTQYISHDKMEEICRLVSMTNFTLDQVLHSQKVNNIEDLTVKAAERIIRRLNEYIDRSSESNDL